MKNLRIMLLGLALLLFGLGAILLGGLQGTPTFHNDAWELLGVICPIAGLALCLFGCLRKES